MGSRVEQYGGDDLGSGQDEQCCKVRFDLADGLWILEAFLEFGKSAVVQENKAQHPGKKVEYPFEDRKNPDISRPHCNLRIAYIWAMVKASMRTRTLVGLLVKDSFFRKEVSQNL